MCASVAPPNECHCFVNASPQNYAWWVGQNSGPIFLAVCGPKCTKLRLPVRECPQFATPFSDWRCLVAFRRHSWSSHKVMRNRAKFYVLGPPNFGGKRPPKFLTELYKHESPSTMWQSLVTIGQATLEIRRRKKETKEDRKDSSKT